ncbi:glycosyltransferase family 4 protein [Vibrio renipiscarius]|uniref:Glycosyl transferase n=1 Tax=Vibrio renipiscarius TaxID=1461322 RepID=A0A0C2KB01_9VIBR|nr:glycosyltransferase family 4 protein [Vibrio renipiscarius]KII76029.1 glycosyl transferase [Vibrio renipiscarius]KII79133.1 glycosyl transferase [Vibrio renipiscarius]
MKVLNISETTQGGIETFFESLSRSQSVENDFLALNYHRSILPLQDKGFRPFNVLMLLWTVIFRIDLKQYQVIFLHSTFSGLLRPFLWPFSKWHNIAIVYCSHGWAFDIHYRSKLKRSIFRTLYICVERILAPFCCQIYCISQYEYREALKIGLKESKVTLVWNGVQGSALPLPIRDTDSRLTRILFVGRLDKQKGLHLFIEALDKLRALNQPIELTVIGEAVRNDCPELDVLFTKARDNITIRRLGWVANTQLDVHFQQADFVVVPSLWEGFGLIVAESLRNGTPVFASDAGSLADMLNEKTGWIFNLDSVSSLSQSIDHVLTEKAYLDISQQACVEHFERNFHEDVMNQRYFQSFLTLN